METDIRRRHWLNDADVSHCSGCKEPFSTIGRRRHHCRQCGHVFCAECSAVRIPLPEEYGYGMMKVRVCDNCVMNGLHPVADDVTDRLAIKEHINKSLKLALNEKTQALERCRSLLLRIDFSGRHSERPELNTKRIGSEGSDDELDSDIVSIERLIRRCEASFKELTEALNFSEDTRTKLESTIEGVQTTQRLKDQIIFDLRHHVHDVEKELQQLQNVADEKDALISKLENQDRELVEAQRLLKGLERRCQLLEATQTTNAVSNVFGKQPNPSWPSNDLQEPFIQVYSDGGISHNQREGRFRRRLRASESLAVHAGVPLVHWMKTCCCCCCRRRSQDAIPSVAAPNSADSMRADVIGNTREKKV